MKPKLGTVVFLLLLGAAVGFVAYFAIDRYYESHRRSSEEVAARFVADASARKIIPVEIEVTAPPETPKDQTLYLSGSEPSLGNWDAAGVPLERGSDGKYRATIHVTAGVEYAFKVTRGTWSTVEKGPQGEEMENRLLRCDQPQSVPVTVASWVDRGLAVPTRITLVGDIRLHKKFASKLLGNERTIAVYLPPGYDHDPQRRYPVLYMHDGQNLFDEASSYAGVEWRLDEAAQALINSGQIEPIIIVGVYNTLDRTREFTPPPTGQADRYGRFIVEELKPFIDQTYRTLSDRAHTSMGGSSLGGLATLYVAKTHGDIFSQIALLTPFLRVEGKPVIALLDGSASWLAGVKVWLDMGPSPMKYYPGDDPVQDARAFVKLLDDAGLKPDADYKYVELSEGEHTEASWQQRAADVLLFLYGKRSGATTGESN